MVNGPAIGCGGFFSAASKIGPAGSRRHSERPEWAWRRSSRPVVAGFAETKRLVLKLRRIGGREGADHRHSVRRHQRQVLAIGRELEIRVQPAAGSVRFLPEAKTTKYAPGSSVTGGNVHCAGSLALSVR